MLFYSQLVLILVDACIHNVLTDNNMCCLLSMVAWRDSSAFCLCGWSFVCCGEIIGSRL